MIKRLPILVLWILVLAAWVYGRFDGGFHPWFLFYTALAIALLESYVYLCGVRFVQLTRHLSGTHFHAGNTLTVTIHLMMPYWAKVPYILIEDSIPGSLRSAFYDQKQVVFPGLHRHLEAVYKIHDLKRGLHTFTKIHCETGDIFGLIRRRKWVLTEDQITVYPKIVPVRGWRELKRFTGLGHGVIVRNQSNDGNQIYGVREYYRGDRMSRIHWPATARTNVLKSKEFEAIVDENVVLMLNRSEVAQSSRSEACFELAVTVTGSLMKNALEKQLAVQLVSVGLKRHQFIITQSNDSMHTVMDHLAKMQQDGKKSFYESVQSDFGHIQKGQLVVMITPVLDDSMLLAIQELQRRGLQVECFLCDVEKKELPESMVHSFVATSTDVRLYTIRSERDLMNLQREEHHRALVR